MNQTAKTLLVIDDDNLVRKSLADALEQQGFQVIQAADGEAGLEQALSAKPDMVITDVKMPQLDGLDMMDRLRQDEWGSSVPVVFLTSDESTDTVNQALSAGVISYLPKSSLSPDEIAEQINQFFQS